MRTLLLTIKNQPVARIMGDDLDQRARIHWFRFSTFDLRSGETWLRFDAQPTTAEDAPNGMGEEKTDRRQSNVTFDVVTDSKQDGVWEIRPNSFFQARFFWRNPLTPASRGVWIRLLLKRDKDALVVVPRDGGSDSRIWSFSADKFDWKDKELFAAVTRPSSLAEALSTAEYVPKDGTGCRLLTRARNRTWIVDASTREDLHKGYRLQFLDAANEIRPLAARFFAESGSYAVNGAALRSEALTAASLDANTIELVCAPFDGTKRYLVEWTHRSAAGPPLEQLSLNTLYHAQARHYALGMAAARSRNRLSFAPTQLNADSMRLRFDVDENDEALLREVIVDKGTSVDWVTGAASETGTRPITLTFKQDVESDPLRKVLAGIGKRPEEGLLLRGPGSSGALKGGWVVNGVVIEIKKLLTAELKIGRGPDEGRYGQAPATVDLRLAFSEATIAPVSDDPEIGFEALSAWLDRERPIVVDLRKDNPPVKVAIHEFANEKQSRILRIGVRNPASVQQDYVVNAVVLDPSPLTAARVRSTTTVDPDGLLAEYSDDSDQAPEWAFASSEGEMDVVLPPQVIGEEMVKGLLHTGTGDGRSTIPAKGEPFDFRLSPPARLVLDRTDINTARTVAPWSLRRLLGQRPGVVGAKLRSAQFELLYGLLSKIEDVPGLRIAELDALVGRVPFPDEFLDFLRAARGAADADSRRLLTLRSDYCQLIADVIHAMLYRPSWWPVFRDFTARQQPTITGKGVSSSLRPSRATANPFDFTKFHDLLTREDRRPPLRGGVDWPFQSRNVYDELTGKPDSSSVTIEGLAFGSLGGWGKQTAEFNNGKTLIISETTQGRLDSVTVIRIGRIAMLWNRARHVIVYERTTRRAPRYAIPPDNLDKDTWEFQAQDFDGFAALRKVREYVQITEQKRTYPDTSTTRPIAGPLKASFFETTIIPVKSSWGYDVPNGFVIALRGPLTDAEKDFFPFPKIFLKQARARSKGEGTVDHQLKDPSELLFFTSTRPEDGGDTDLWPAAPDIDFPLMRPKTAILPFKSRFTRSRKQPDAPLADFGQKRFTITLNPPEEAVDLMHGRLSEGIEARVTSVSMARGRAPFETPLQAGSLTAKIGDSLANTHPFLHDGLSELRMQVAQARHDGAAALGDIPGFAAEALALVNELGGRASDLSSAIPTTVPAFNWTDEQQRWNDKLKRNLDRQVDAWREQLRLPGGATADNARSALQSVCQQVHQRIDDIGFLPMEALNRIDIAGAALTKRMNVLKDEMLVDFKAAVDRIAARYAELVATNEQSDEVPALVAPGLAALQKDVDAVLAGLSAALSRVDADALKHLADDLGTWFSGDGLLGRLGTAVRELAADLVFLAAEILSAVSPVEIEEPDWSALKNDTKALLDDFVAAVTAALKKEIEDLSKTLLGADGKLKALSDAGIEVEGFCNDALAAIDAGNLAKALDDFIKGAAGVLKGDGDQLKGIGDRLNEKLDDLVKNTGWGKVSGTFNSAANFAADMTQGFGDLRGALAGDLSLEEVERRIALAAKNITASLEATSRQVERAVVNEVQKLTKPIEAAANTAALELTRILATGPINDAITCTRDQLGYYYDAAKDALDVTRAGAVFNEIGQSVLNSLSTELPFDRIRDRLLPQLKDIDLSQLLPNFGGLKLEHLFPDLKAPDDGSENDWIRVRHGFDKDRLTAFANVDVDKVIEGDPTVFMLPPISLKLRAPHFLASSQLELSSSGGKSQSTKASINADWLLCLSDKPVVTLRDATLQYDSDGGFGFLFESENVQLAPEFDFITKALKDLLPQEEGLTLTPIMPAGIRAELGLPLPDLTTGAFTLTGITLYAFMELLIADGFEIRTGFWLSKPQRPFGLAVVFLGGGGWVGFEVAYRPPDRFVTRVSIGISAGAFVAINFGVARGSAGILFTAGVDFFRDFKNQSGRTLITLGVLVWGEFSILGIASASLRLMLSVTYDGSDGSMTGHGSVDVSIKICWCFTLNVHQAVSQRFVGGSSKSDARRSAPPPPRDHQKAIQAVNSNVAL